MILNILNGQLTRHFNIKEFVHVGTYIYIDEDFLFFVNMLEQFRVWYNRVINITSCYRPSDYNASVGGSKNSSHLKSLAVDFPLPAEFKNFSRDRKNEFLQNVNSKWIDICHSNGYGCQCNFYDTYLHLGIGDKDSFIDKRSL